MKKEKTVITPEMKKAALAAKKERQAKKEQQEERNRIASHKAREKRLAKAVKQKVEDKKLRIEYVADLYATAPKRRELKEAAKQEQKRLLKEEKAAKIEKYITEFREKSNIPDNAIVTYDEKTNRFKVQQPGVVEDGKLVIDNKEEEK